MKIFVKWFGNFKFIATFISYVEIKSVVIFSFVLHQPHFVYLTCSLNQAVAYVDAEWLNPFYFVSFIWLTGYFKFMFRMSRVHCSIVWILINSLHIIISTAFVPTDIFYQWLLMFSMSWELHLHWVCQSWQYFWGIYLVLRRSKQIT